MSAEKIDFKQIDKSKYTIYLKKAGDFFRAMIRDYEDKNWHSTGLTAVHCAVSVTDALLAKFAGIRSSSKDHMDSARLLTDKVKGKDADKYSEILAKILALKNRVEYEDRLLTEKETEELFKRTERYYGWAKSIIGE
jgi:HEPN domain-containing protein